MTMLSPVRAAPTIPHRPASSLSRLFDDRGADNLGLRPDAGSVVHGGCEDQVLAAGEHHHARTPPSLAHAPCLAMGKGKGGRARAGKMDGAQVR